MGLAFIPLYIGYIGIEAYALIGLFTLLTTWLSLLDLGMTPTLSREMARLTGGIHTPQSIRNLLRTIEFITLGITAMIAGGVFLASDWIANSWLQTEALATHVVAEAIAIMGLVAGLRFAETIYRSSMLGLQRQVLFNVVNSILVTIRGFGAVAILALVEPSIQAFFLWQGFVSLLSLITIAGLTYACLPRAERNARFSLESLRSVWRFAGGMLGISFLALLLTQSDKILLSRIISLKDYGYYTLAVVVASVIYPLLLPITTALYPRMCELYTRKNCLELIDTYHRGAQLVSVVAGSPAIVIILFSETLLRLWTQDLELSRTVAPLLSLLMLGNLLNGLMHMPYQVQLAYGWTSLTIKINIIAIILVAPALFWVASRYGAEGAASVWVALNVGYLISGAHFMYRKILTAERWRWYIHDLILPLGAALTVASLLKLIWPHAETALAEFLLLGTAVVFTMGAAILGSDYIRPYAIQFFQNSIRLWKLYK